MVAFYSMNVSFERGIHSIKRIDTFQVYIFLGDLQASFADLLLPSSSSNPSWSDTSCFLCFMQLGAAFGS